ncbi:hypothetical protein H5410_000991 [Solanum commersonii]|uniref:Uncharacterized protein n=1 Tax=Solanum commersonii TaxID=4109 RepID=A0A9J6AYB8_SOLCO|nr:hypothetical protein H5410_000991 [Solanum commersonii]
MPPTPPFGLRRTDSILHPFQYRFNAQGYLDSAEFLILLESSIGGMGSIIEYETIPLMNTD